MSGGGEGRPRSLAVRWVELAARRARLVVFVSLVAAVAAGAWSAARFRVDTDRNAMLSSSLAFKREEERIDRLFPQLADSLVIVVDARTPERARAVALELAGELVAREELFRGAYVPRADPYLERHGLLFRSPEELRELGARLAEAQPFLGRLTRDPSLRGLFELTARAYEARGEGRTVELDRVEEGVAPALFAAVAGEARETSWRELLRPEGERPPDDRRQFVLAEPLLDYGRVLAGEPAIDAVRALVAERGLEADGTSVRVTGGLALSTEELSSVLRGAEVIAALVLVLVGAVLHFTLRSWRQVANVLVVLLVGLALTAAFALTAIGHFNLISIAFAALYLGLGVDYAIHYCLRYQELVGAGVENRAALAEAARDVGGSLALCALTTSIGFLSFVPTAYSGVSELGLISAAGMFVSLAVTLTLLPALLVLRPLRPARAPRPVGERGRLARLLDLPVRRSGAVLAAAAALGVVALALAPAIRFDPNPLRLRDPDSESVRTFRALLETSATPPWSAQVLAADEDEARATAERLGGLEAVDEVVWLESFVPRDQEEKLAQLEELGLVLGGELQLDRDAPRPTTEEQLAAVRELAAAMGEPGDAGGALLKEALAELEAALDAGSPDAKAELLARAERNVLASLPESLELLREGLAAGPVTVADLPEELRARWRSADGTYRVEAFPRAGLDLERESDLVSFVGAVQGVAPAAVGGPIVMWESGRAVVGAFRQALSTAVVAIGLVVLVVLRRPRDVALVLAPLLLAALLTGATMVAFGAPFHFANVIALPLLLGIGVDSGIHMVHRARFTLDPSDNPLRTSTARGVFFSALTTIASFVNLALSSHPGTAGMGATLAIALAWTLVCSLVVLPALLARVR